MFSKDILLSHETINYLKTFTVKHYDEELRSCKMYNLILAINFNCYDIFIFCVNFLVIICTQVRICRLKNYEISRPAALAIILKKSKFGAEGVKIKLPTQRNCTHTHENSSIILPTEEIYTNWKNISEKASNKMCHKRVD